MLPRARKSIDKTATVGIASSINARVVDAEIGLEVIDHIRSESQIAHPWCGIRRPLPVTLIDFQLPLLSSMGQSTYIGSGRIYYYHVGVDRWVGEPNIGLKPDRIASRTMVSHDCRGWRVRVVA